MRSLAGITQRPPWVRLTDDHRHPLRRDLLFLGAGQHPGSTKFVDAGHYGFHGTLSAIAMSEWSRLPDGRTGVYSGAASSHVLLPYSEILRPADITLSAVIRLRVMPTVGMIMVARSGNTEISGAVLFVYLSRLQFWITLNGTSWGIQIDSDATITTGVTYHVCGTFRSGEAILYVNGIAQSGASSATGSIVYVAGRAWAIGGAPSGTKNSLAGEVYDPAIWGRVLRPAEIQSLYPDPMMNGLLEPLVPHRARRAITATGNRRRRFLVINGGC